MRRILSIALALAGIFVSVMAGITRSISFMEGPAVILLAR